MNQRILWAVLLGILGILISMCKSVDMPEENSHSSAELDSLWRAYDSLDTRGYPETAEKQLKVIENVAVQRGSEADRMAAIFSRYNLLIDRALTGEVDEEAGIEYLWNTEIKEGTISQHLLAYARAQSLSSYYQTNQRTIESRTEVSSPSLDAPVETWTRNQFLEAIFTASDRALHPRLKEAKVKDWGPVLNRLEDSSMLVFRPHLFAVVAQSLTQRLSASLMQSIPMSEHPILRDSMWWSDRAQFVTHDFGYEEEAPGRLVKVFQRSLSELADPQVLLDVDLSRYSFIRSHGRQADREGKWKKVLMGFMESNPGQPARARIATELVEYYFNQRENTDDSGRSGYARAMDLIENEKLNGRKDVWGERARRIELEVERPHLSAKLEAVVLPGQAILVSTTYRNLSQLRYSLYEVNPGLLESINRRNADEFERAIEKQKKVKEGQVDLPVDANYGMKTVEFGVDGLPTGLYVVVLKAEQATFWRQVQVSDLALVRLDDHLFVIDRFSGEGVADAVVDMEVVDWKKKSRDTFSLVTSGRGDLVLKSEQGVKVKRVRKNDRVIYPSLTIHQSTNTAPSAERTEMELYTDRSIYRPGQNIRFKGVFFRRADIENERTISGLEVEISLKDPNYETVQKQKLTTDAFGSVWGDFRIPEGVMAGRYLIHTPFGSNSIEVAEYRRPGFELSTKWPEGAQFTAGDTVQLELQAETYSGFPLTDADVQLSVYRTYAPLWRYGIWPPHREQAQLVQESQLSLNAEGKVDVRFPTEAAVQEGMRAQYEITCEVIDAAGETHEITETIQLSSSPYALAIPISNQIWSESPPEEPWKVKNAMGEPVSATIDWKLHRLPDPTHKYIDRYWSVPDSILMDREEFEENWPHLSYAKEEEEGQFDGDVLKQGQISIQGQSAPPSSLFKDLSGGRFVLRAFDDQGEQLSEQRFDYYPRSQNMSISAPELLWRNPPQSFEAGDNIDLEAVLPFANSRSWIAHKQGDGALQVTQDRSVRIAAQPNDLGSIRAKVFSVIHNRVYSQDLHMDIRRPQKKIEILDVEVNPETRPGQKETYRFKVNHPEDIQLTAAMYDESLDAIQAYKWQRLPLGQKRAMLNLQAFDFSGQGFRSIRFFDYPRTMYVRSLEWPSFKLRELPQMRVMSDAVAMESFDAKGRGMEDEMEPPRSVEPSAPPKNEEEATQTKEPKIRKNLDETVFFMPDIKKTSDGFYEISFEMNEALTRWKLLLLAHDQKLASGTFSTSVVSKQQVSIRPFFPRILRAGDSIHLSARLESTLDLEDAVVSIELQNAITGKEVTQDLIAQPAAQVVTATAGKPLAISWKMVVPEPHVVPAIQLISRVKSAKGSDAESHILPVLSDRVLLTDALPLEVAENSSGVWDVSAENLNADLENGQRILKYKLDVNLQPVWQAIQALPYLSRPQNASIPAKINVLFANSMGIEVAKAIPNLREQLLAFEKAGMGESPLSQSEEWKNTDLDQSPWVQSARKESEQMGSIAKLLDVNRQNYERRRILQDLYNVQNADGGFPWMPGGRSSTYVTQYICKELLRMKSLNLIEDEEIEPVLRRALSYCFNHYEKHMPAKSDGYPGHFSNNFLVYIYYLGAEAAADSQVPTWDAWSEHKPKLEKHLREEMSSLSIAQQALLGMAWHRTGKKDELNELIQSWRERARKDSVLGWSWSSQGRFDYFHSRMESQAMVIELCEKVGASEMSRGAKKFLLKEKQVRQWGNSKSTAAAIHAMLLQGDKGWRNPKPVSWTARGAQPKPDLQIGESFIHWERAASAEGSFEPPVQRLELDNPNPFPIWGSVHVQYSSALDNIESTGSGSMEVETTYYLEESGSTGAELVPVGPNTRLEKGDVLVSRVQATVDRTMDFIHIEQFRPSSLEPIVQKSGYKFGEGTSFYRSVKDEGTHFFIDELQRGTHIFEFKERVAHAGRCTGGFTRIESFYAPEFKAHGSGQKIRTNDR